MADLVFVIDGKDYESPDMATLTMAERRIMYDLAEIVQEDFVQQEDETESELAARVHMLTRHPGFLESLMHIAFARGNPTMKRERVQAVIGNTNFQEAIEKWAEDDVEVPPAQEPTSTPDSKSLTEHVGSNNISGPGSTNGSDEPDATLANTGRTKSDMLSMSAPTRPAA